jgi:hypothetical protein
MNFTDFCRQTRVAKKRRNNPRELLRLACGLLYITDPSVGPTRRLAREGRRN